MKVYDLRTNSMKNPMGVSDADFSWKTETDKENARQSAYRIIVAEDAGMQSVVWDSTEVESDKSVCVPFEGELKPQTVYFWSVTVRYGDETAEGSAVFETGLMKNDSSVWNGAKWIGFPYKCVNTAAMDSYSVEARFLAKKTTIALAARNKDNCTLIDIDTAGGVLRVRGVCDNAWRTPEEAMKEDVVLAEYRITANPNEYSTVKAEVTENARMSIVFNGEIIADKADILPENRPCEPDRRRLMNIGICQEGTAFYKSIRVCAQEFERVYTFENANPLPQVGDVSDGVLVVKDRFELIAPSPSLNVRKKFEIKKKPVSARLYSTAKGFYAAFVNGEKADDSYYNPNFTDYGKRIQYQTFDVTDKLVLGENTLTATVTKGYYSGFCGYSGAMVYGKQNYFMAQLVAVYEDGSTDVIVTDDTWQCTDMGSVVDSDYLDGETVDARLSFDNEKIWKNCGCMPQSDEVKPVNGVFEEKVPFEISAQLGPLAREERRLEAKFIGECPKGHFIYDCSQNIAGSVMIRARAKRGTSIKVRYGEMLQKNGAIYVRNLRSAANTDVYTFAGGRTEEFVPTYTAHGFRYIEITSNGGEGIWEVEKVEAIVITNVTEKVGSFECSQPLVNRLQKNIEWGQRGNYIQIPTDCPQRNERQGWTGDAQVFAATAAYNMDVKTFTQKWLLDLADAQIMYNMNGGVPDTAPLGGDNRPNPCAGWADAAVIVPWEMYRVYGDKKILEDCYDMMKKWAAWQSRKENRNRGIRTVDGRVVPEKSNLSKEPFIQRQQRRGDHLAPDETTPFILSATAYAAHTADIMAKAARILGRKRDAEIFAERFKKIKKAFNDAWVSDDGSISYIGEMSKSCADRDGNIISETEYSRERASQTAYALALRFGLIDDDKRKNAALMLWQNVRENGFKISVGFLGIAHILYALSDNGYGEAAFKLLEQEEFPSWLYSVKNGATTIWERWNSYIAATGKFGDVAMNSFNHYSYGAVGEWMFSYIAGISPKEAGYKVISLTPHWGGSMKWARAELESPYGKIVSHWERNDDTVEYRCTVPANTRACLTFPSGKSVSLGSGSYSFKLREGVLL